MLDAAITAVKGQNGARTGGEGPRKHWKNGGERKAAHTISEQRKRLASHWSNAIFIS
jgi:hypothetical protein